MNMVDELSSVGLFWWVCLSLNNLFFEEYFFHFWLKKNTGVFKLSEYLKRKARLNFLLLEKVLKVHFHRDVRLKPGFWLFA